MPRKLLYEKDIKPLSRETREYIKSERKRLQALIANGDKPGLGKFYADHGIREKSHVDDLIDSLPVDADKKRALKADATEPKRAFASMHPNARAEALEKIWQYDNETDTPFERPTEDKWVKPNPAAGPGKYVPPINKDEETWKYKSVAKDDSHYSHVVEQFNDLSKKNYDKNRDPAVVGNYVPGQTHNYYNDREREHQEVPAFNV